MDSSLLIEKEPAMCGKATFAIVSSNTNMNAAKIVGIAPSQGPYLGFHSWLTVETSAVIIYYFTLTFGTTDIPETIVYSSGLISSSNTIFTGIRCTIFTNEPTAFSGGKRLALAPEAR